MGEKKSNVGKTAHPLNKNILQKDELCLFVYFIGVTSMQ